MKIVKMNETHVEDFWRLRYAMLEELCVIAPDADRKELEKVNKDFYLENIGKLLFYYGIWEDGEMVTSGAISLLARMPYSGNPTGREGYLFNIYTSHAYRRKGYARIMMEALVQCAKEERIGRLWLHATEAGKGLYRSFGFDDMKDNLELFVKGE